MHNEYVVQAMLKAKMREFDDFIKEQYYVRQQRKIKKASNPKLFKNSRSKALNNENA
ncbi:hypothetical protein [Lederbergia panacisoli]|uniref:hypothetical protein n=1 Tax=Lederbergia panacisoli TaxID=1255251 RepID=UPI00214C33E2|nr:hypothetical protein [Lederbergia panacisoli]MCR2821745.1 hypothetical protein [Lederbergia panacisoli]